MVSPSDIETDMDGATLAALMRERRDILRGLHEVGKRQIDIIAAGHMSELMSLLAQKQRPLNRLGEIAELLKPFANQDHRHRSWPSQECQDQCRADQRDCERLHVELLAIEAQCESALEVSRESIRQELQRIDVARQAATSYSSCETPSTTGGRLDLTE